MENQSLAQLKRDIKALIEQHDKRLEEYERWGEAFKNQLAEYDRVIAELALKKLLHYVDYVL
jgi:hypothetical protein